MLKITQTYAILSIIKKVGIRKSIFTDAEKEVTQSVILKREQNAQELVDNQMTIAINGSSGQLNIGN